MTPHVRPDMAPEKCAVTGASQALRTVGASACKCACLGAVGWSHAIHTTIHVAKRFQAVSSAFCCAPSSFQKLKSKFKGATWRDPG